MSLNNVEKLVATIVAESQAIENATLDMQENMTLENATGVNLDLFGSIVGAERGSATDDEYRETIRGQIRANLSGGTIEDILTVLGLVYGGSPSIVHTEGRVAEFEDDIRTSTSPAKALRMAKILKKTKAGGVKGNLKYFDTEPTFAFDGAGGAKADGGYYLASSIDSGST